VIDNLIAEYTAAVAEIKAESTQPNVEKPEVEQPEVDKAEKPEVRSTSREGND
jgi:chorismate mutase